MRKVLLIISLFLLMFTLGSCSKIKEILADYIPDLFGDDYATLQEVLPDGNKFEDITETLVLEDGIINVYKETKGIGYVVRVYEACHEDDIEVLIGINSDGKITGLTVDFKQNHFANENTINSYIGKDSNLLDIVLTSGATTTCTSLKNAVSKCFLVLVENNLVKSAARAAQLVFEELLPTVTSGFSKGDDLTPAGDIYKAYLDKTGNVVVCFVDDDTTKLMALSNTSNCVTLYSAKLVDSDTQTYVLEDVTDENYSIVQKVEAYVNERITVDNSYLFRAIGELYPDADSMNEFVITTYSSVVYGLTVSHAGQTLYAYISTTIGFDERLMEIIVILDASGRIYQVEVDKLFDDDIHYNVSRPNISESEYEDMFTGVSGENYHSSDFLLAGATQSQNAVNQAIKDAFAEFNKR